MILSHLFPEGHTFENEIEIGYATILENVSIQQTTQSPLDSTILCRNISKDETRVKFHTTLTEENVFVWSSTLLFLAQS
jgi:hypothetical protein